MVATDANEAVSNSKSYTHCDSGMCLKYTRTWLEIGSGASDAKGAWDAAQKKHTDRNPKRGAPVFWSGGSSGHGHIALGTSNQSDPSSKIRTTDAPGSGSVSTQDLAWVENNWGLHYLGWTEDLNGIAIPWLEGGPENSNSKWDSGKVYVNKLQHRQQDSDSVGRLCYRLRNLNAMPGSHRPPHQVVNYTDEILEAVRYWQRNIKPDVKGPSDGISMSNQQANTLFGENYNVIEK